MLSWQHSVWCSGEGFAGVQGLKAFAGVQGLRLLVGCRVWGFCLGYSAKAWEFVPCSDGISPLWSGTLSSLRQRLQEHCLPLAVLLSWLWSTKWPCIITVQSWYATAKGAIGPAPQAVTKNSEVSVHMC